MVSSTSSLAYPTYSTTSTSSTSSTAPTSTTTSTATTTAASSTQSTTTQSTTSSATTTATTATTLSAQDILKQPPFAPSDVNLFTPQTYSSATAMQPASTPRSSTEIRNLVISVANKRFNGSLTSIKSVLAVMDDSTVKKYVPDIRLRASLALLKGTPGESAIDDIKAGKFKGVEFATLPAGSSAASSVLKSGDTKRTLVFNDRYQHEDPRLLSGLLAHESLHSDSSNSQKEELMANGIEAIIHGQMIKEDSSVARSGTELARIQNTQLMALLNSRDTNGNIRLTVSQGNVYPGGTPLDNFAAAFGPLGSDTPGSTNLQKMLQKITKLTMSGAAFNDATLATFDKNIKVFSATDWVGIARAMKLNA